MKRRCLGTFTMRETGHCLSSYSSCYLLVTVKGTSYYLLVTVLTTY